MKVAKKVVFKFDPDNAGIPALTDFYGKILWACLKTGHITDQYFSGNVQDVALRLNENFPSDYDKFKQIISLSRLRDFGIKISGFAGSIRELDDEFWQGVYRYLTREEKLNIVIDCGV